MVFANSLTDTADAAFVRTAAADAGAVSSLREEFARWLRNGFRLDAVRHSDIVLAVNEAMANAAEYAYRDGGRDRTFCLQARRDGPGVLAVTVADRGTWREAAPASKASARGRGIPLMRALADRFAIDPSPQGTRVYLGFDGCAAALRPVASA
jgi:serine/threonine-protein kinase RsbW